VGDAPRNAELDAIAALSAEMARFRELSDAAFEALVVHDHGVIVDANQAFLEMFGYRRAELTGLRALDLCAPESRDTVTQKMASGATAPYESVGLRRDGSKFLGQLRGGPIHYQGRNLRVVAIRDISEQRQLEAQVQLSQQLLSMNSLAAGVAHEINNPLTYVLGNLQIMAQLMDDLVAGSAVPPVPAAELRRCLDETMTGTERVRGIVGDLRRLAKPSGPERVAVDLRPALESALRLAGNELRHRARVARRWGDAPPVLGIELRLV
jgi:PAS domain S-box-containing protein